MTANRMCAMSHFFSGISFSWIVANRGWFIDYLEMHLGQWGMIGVLLLIVVIVLLGRFFLF